MTRQRIPGSCCSRRKRAVTQCRTASCRHQQSRSVSRSTPPDVFQLHLCWAPHQLAIC